MRSMTMLRRAAACALLLMAAACGGGHGAADDPADASAALDCERLDYPCAWSQVAAAVAADSDARGDALYARLAGGESTAAAATWLKAQGPLAELQVDADKLRFRLPGGRPVWVVRPGVLEAARTGAGVPEPAASRRKAARVIRAGSASRRALVLAPYRYEGEHMSAGTVPGQLEAMPDYAGNVTVHQNTAVTDTQAGVEDFARFADYDVVHVATHGVDLCFDLQTGAPLNPCKIAILARMSNNPVVDLAQASRIGVELIKFEPGSSSLGVTADFFRAVYPLGLNDKLIYFDACLGADMALMGALGGGSGVYLGWTGLVRSGVAQSVSSRLYAMLADGLPVQQALEQLGYARVQDAVTELLDNRRDLRIRDIIEVSDASSGAPLAEGGVDASKRPGDGEPDTLHLDIDLAGLQADQLDGLALQVLRGSQTLASVPLAGQAAEAGPWRQHMNLQLPLGVDTQAGETLALEFRVGLPEGGESVLRVSPRVNDPAAMPAKWLMTSKLVSHGVGSTVTKVAQITWELEPGDNPAGRYHYYRVKSGRLHIIYEGEVNGCRVAYETSMPVPEEAANNSLKFDLGDKDVLLSAFGKVPDQPFQATGTCADGSMLQYGTTVGGVYLIADDQVVSGTGSFAGGYNDGAQLPTVVEYQFTPVR